MRRREKRCSIRRSALCSYSETLSRHLQQEFIVENAMGKTYIFWIFVASRFL